MSSVSTKFLDVNKRRIMQSANGAFYIKKGGKRVYGNKAAFRKVGSRVTGISNIKKVPRGLVNRLTLPKHEGTMHGIEDWYRHLFKHFGWMIIARAKGNGGKIRSYKKSINDLLKTIDNTMSEYKENNRKHDLKIIKRHVEVLKDYAKML